MTQPRVLLATAGFPPAQGGSAALLYELLRHLPAGSLAVVHQHLAEVPGGDRLPFPARSVSVFGSLRWTERLFRRAPGLALKLVRRTILRAAREYRVERIYAHYPDAFFVIAAWQVARELGLPLTLYFDILWEEGTAGVVRNLAREYEGEIARYADRRFAITEFAADYLTRKHGLTWEFVPHTLDVTRVPEGPATPPQRQRPTVHFAGTVYAAMNLDAMERLLEAVRRSRTRPVLDLCTTHRFPGVGDDVATYRFLSRSQLIAAQRDADVLFLPQAFLSSAPEMIRNNLPTKIIEYLTAGRPILVHSPADSYLTWLARSTGFAAVVDTPDAAGLTAALDEVLSTPALQASLVAQTRELALSRNSQTWAKTIHDALFPTLAAASIR